MTQKAYLITDLTAQLTLLVSRVRESSDRLAPHNDQVGSYAHRRKKPIKLFGDAHVFFHMRLPKNASSNPIQSAPASVEGPRGATVLLLWAAFVATTTGGSFRRGCCCRVAVSPRGRRVTLEDVIVADLP